MGLGTADAAETQLVHLTGARFLASFLLVCGNFCPGRQLTVFTAARHRGNAVVCFFIVMSGFITHWVYSSRILGGQLKEFYVRRVGRVVITTWVAMGLGVLVLYIGDWGLDEAHLLRCFSFLESWRDPEDWCPNGQTWTVAALLPSWLIYPLTCRGIDLVEKHVGALGLMTCLVALFAASFGAIFVTFIQQGGYISSVQHTWNYIWPPAQLADFAIGAVAAALAQRHAAFQRIFVGRCDFVRGTLADLSVLVVVGVVICLPSSAEDGQRVGWEPLLNHGLAPLYAAFLYGSAARGGMGIAARLLRHDALVGLGALSFEVYLFQWPLHEGVQFLGEKTGLYNMHEGYRIMNPSAFMAFVFLLWLAAGLYSEFIQGPVAHCLRRVGDGDNPHQAGGCDNDHC
mmetsp:Transcript_104611/g.223594  ORF Transcript_104611/g.223594 Transcript_104611/m.223594 type:complete len:400 (+) Transcript_104611:99-1298(+)